MALTDMTKEVLERLLQDEPDTTHAKIAKHFGCNPKTVAARLKEFGLRTKVWSERTHKPSTREKIGQTRKERGVAKGSRNPNYGEKHRPWLEGENHPLRQWHRENPDFGDRQRGENNPIHQVRHLYEDPEYVERITRGIRAHVDEKRGSSYEEVYGPEKAAEYKQKLRDASPARLAKFERKETEPERVVREILEQLAVPFTSQAPIGFYTVDFLVHGRKLVIQADGDYWHAHPDKFGSGVGKTPLSDVQRKRRRLDASCDSYLKNAGYGVLRLWECDLHEDPDRCCSRILQALQALEEPNV